MTDHVLISRVSAAMHPLTHEDPAAFLAEVVRTCQPFAAAVLNDAASILIDEWRSTPSNPWPSVAKIKEACERAQFRAQAAAAPAPRDPSSHQAKAAANALLRAHPSILTQAIAEHWIVPLRDWVCQHDRMPTANEVPAIRARGQQSAAKANQPGHQGMIGRAYLARCQSYADAIRNTDTEPKRAA